MPTFQRCDPSVNELANDLRDRFYTHGDLEAEGVTVDYVFAFCDRDEDGNALNHALQHNGVKALGICKIIGKKERALGRSDAEISLDGDWWDKAEPAQREALLDHELYHLAVKRDRSGDPKRDDLHRPVLELRKHDYQFGWFRVIAARHGEAAQERIQAKKILDRDGQYFWPELTGAGELSSTALQEAAEQQAQKRPIIGNFKQQADTYIGNIVDESNRQQEAASVDADGDPVPPKLQKAVAKFRTSMAKAVGKGGSVTISSGDKKTVIHGDAA